MALRELITFQVASQGFCVDIVKVREIRGWTPVTPVPMAPAHVCGVVNLRGAILPIIDLAARLGFPSSTPTARHAIMVCQAGDQVAGLLVDAVSDIVTVSEDAIQPTPDMASEAAQSLVTGLLTVEGRMLSLMALEEVFPKATAPLAA